MYDDVPGLDPDAEEQERGKNLNLWMNHRGKYIEKEAEKIGSDPTLNRILRLYSMK